MTHRSHFLEAGLLYGRPHVFAVVLALPFSDAHDADAPGAYDTDDVCSDNECTHDDQPAVGRVFETLLSLS